MAYVIAVLLGALFGAVAENGFGACVGALLGWLVVRATKQQRELLALRGLIGEIKAGALGAKPSVATPAGAVAAEATPPLDAASPGPVVVPPAPVDLPAS